MATDEPTPPDLGNITDAQFLALVDWAVQTENVDGKDDTFETMRTCIVALLYRLVRDNMQYLNNALACRVDTPLSLAAKAGVETKHWTSTDWPALGMTLLDMVGASPLPDIIFSCNGTKLDDVSGTLALNPPSPGTSLTYPVVSGGGSRGATPAYPFVFGVRTHAGRTVYADDTALVKTADIAYQASYSLPEWPQDTQAPIVLAKVADFTSATDTGPSNRIGFEFGLGPSPTADPNSTERDYVLYVRWYDALNVEQRVIAKLPGAYADHEPISITPGRRITLGFHRYFTFTTESFTVKFFVNGLAVNDPEDPLVFVEDPDIASSANIRLHIGSAQLGASYTGGPVNNVMVWSDPPDAPTTADSMLTAYRRGEGFEAVP